MKTQHVVFSGATTKSRWKNWSLNFSFGWHFNPGISICLNELMIRNGSKQWCKIFIVQTPQKSWLQQWRSESSIVNKRKRLVKRQVTFFTEVLSLIQFYTEKLLFGLWIFLWIFFPPFSSLSRSVSGRALYFRGRKLKSQIIFFRWIHCLPQEKKLS